MTTLFILLIICIFFCCLGLILIFTFARNDKMELIGFISFVLGFYGGIIVLFLIPILQILKHFNIV